MRKAHGFFHGKMGVPTVERFLTEDTEKIAAAFTM
jgi:hypothetical protein